MTLDDLMKAYAEGQASLRNKVKYAPAEYFERAGIRAVVEALRDEVVNKSSRCGWCLANGDLAHVNDTINEILGGAGDQAAGGPTSNDGHKDNGCITPAGPKPAADPYEPITGITDFHRGRSSDPSLEVCEWELDFPPFAWTSCNGEQKFAGGTHCPSCGLPIKFKEPTP